MKFEDEFTNVDKLDGESGEWDQGLRAARLLDVTADECFVANRHNTLEVDEVYDEVMSRASEHDNELYLSTYKDHPVVVENDSYCGFYIRQQDFTVMFGGANAAGSLGN